MPTFLITRTELSTEQFRVVSDSPESALDTLNDEMGFPLETEHCELVDISTTHSEVEIREDKA